MEHQFWVARQSVLRRFGSREDECVVASDAELDAKLELFRSVAETSALLQRLAEQLGERASGLAAEEAALGGFLREAGGGGAAGAGRALAGAGRGLAAVGQQRGQLRAPLARLARELDTFRARAVADTRATVRAMERARADYRAALSWMKAASGRLDPDTGKGLHQFRKAQAQVRESKRVFDKLALDCLQKVDLLAAARCNMFSHALVHYQNSLLNFSTKASQALNLTAQGLSETPSYDFCILKELSQAQDQSQAENRTDEDQMLFFRDEFKDEKDNRRDAVATEGSTEDAEENLADPSVETATDLISTGDTERVESNLNPDLAGLNLGHDAFGQLGSFMPSQLLQDFNLNLSQMTLQPQNVESSPIDNSEKTSPGTDGPQSKKRDVQKKDKAVWFKLFAELDPLANPDAVPGVNGANQSHAA